MSKRPHDNVSRTFYKPCYQDKIVTMLVLKCIHFIELHWMKESILNVFGNVKYNIKKIK